MPTHTTPAPTTVPAIATLKTTAVTAFLYTLITAVLLGLVYPLAITGIAHLLFPRQADGQLITRNGQVVGSRLIGQAFTGPGYFHSRPSNAGAGYDASSSSGSNLGPSSKALHDRIAASITQERDPGTNSSGAVPVDLVTTSASGLDPDISIAAALYQAPRIAQQRHLAATSVRALIDHNTTQRQLGLLGDPRVNVLALNLALDDLAKTPASMHP